MQGDSFPCTLQNKKEKKTMKKFYLDPEMEIIELETQGFLADSTGTEGGNGDGGVIPSEEGGTPGSEGWGGDY